MSDKTASEVAVQLERERAEAIQRSIEAFEKWWHDEGSGMPPQPDEEAEEHVHRVCKIAWINGAFR